MYKYKNLVLEGGGVWGICYLGMAEVLNEKGILAQLDRVAGSSAGAISATLLSFGLPFEELKTLADTLNYSKVPEQGEFLKIDNQMEQVLVALDNKIDNEIKIFDNIQCIIRLITRYGWYSSNYFYTWLQKAIAKQFNDKKGPPYTFADFQNSELHKSGKPFADLHVIGTDISYRKTRIFSVETTPEVEVATAVRISMSVPLFFESIDFQYPKIPQKDIFSDGGTMWNYPISIFDTSGFGNNTSKICNPETLGGHFQRQTPENHEVNNILKYIENLFYCLLAIQNDIFYNTPDDVARTIDIDTKGISALNFNIESGDKTYMTLYNSGKQATIDYFNKLRK